MARLFVVIACLLVSFSQAFVPITRVAFGSPVSTLTNNPVKFQQAINMPATLQHQRKSVASVQTMGLFGLGAPEIAVILVAAAFLLGPQKLAELGKDAGKIAGELKEVPKEFQKGLAEGEESARSMKSVDAVKEEKKE